MQQNSETSGARGITSSYNKINQFDEMVEMERQTWIAQEFFKAQRDIRYKSQMNINYQVIDLMSDVAQNNRQLEIPDSKRDKAIADSIFNIGENIILTKKLRRMKSLYHVLWSYQQKVRQLLALYEYKVMTFIWKVTNGLGLNHPSDVMNRYDTLVFFKTDQNKDMEKVTNELDSLTKMEVEMKEKHTEEILRHFNTMAKLYDDLEKAKREHLHAEQEWSCLKSSASRVALRMFAMTNIINVLYQQLTADRGLPNPLKDPLRQMDDIRSRLVNLEEALVDIHTIANSEYGE